MSRTRNEVPARFGSALDRLDGDVGLLREMASITSEDLPEVRAATQRAIDDGDCEQAAAGLHKLKGMLSTFESDGVTLEIQEILDLARRGKIDEVQENYQQQKAAIDELSDQVSELASAANSSN
ncbi:MAG: Hpt domain-containing protein [Pirellulaceae bacterium]|nr:Hpt domain-containing protein [Pirellulaceae bacterium]